MDNKSEKKEKRLSKGLVKRVGLYIRDNAINGEYRQGVEVIADHLGLTVETVTEVINKLKSENKLREIKHENPLLPLSYVYTGEGAASNLLIEVGRWSDGLLEKINKWSLDDETREFLLEYDGKVREFLFDIQKQTAEIDEYRVFKEGIVKILDTPDELVHIIAKRRP